MRGAAAEERGLLEVVALVGEHLAATTTPRCTCPTLLWNLLNILACNVDFVVGLLAW